MSRAFGRGRYCRHQSAFLPLLDFIQLLIKHNKKFLVIGIREFTDKQKLQANTRQKGKCKLCGKKFEFDEMHGDHIKPWSKGGHTDAKNSQVLCHACNFTKSDK